MSLSAPPRCLSGVEGAARPDQVVLPGFSSSLIGQQSLPSDTGHIPSGREKEKEKKTLLLCAALNRGGAGGRYHSCHVVIPGPLTFDPATLGGRSGEALTKCLPTAVWREGFCVRGRVHGGEKAAVEIKPVFFSLNFYRCHYLFAM